MDAWKTILSFPFGSANVQFWGSCSTSGGAVDQIWSTNILPRSQVLRFHMFHPPKEEYLGIYLRLPSWQPGDVLYFGGKTLQKKALFKQNKGHLGSRIRSPWFFRGCVFPEGFVFFSAFFSDLQEGLRLVKDVDIDQPFSMHGW